MQSSGCLVSNLYAISEARRLLMSSLLVQQQEKHSMQLKFPLFSIIQLANFPSNQMKSGLCGGFIEAERANTSSMIVLAGSEIFVKFLAGRVRQQIHIVLLSKVGSMPCWWRPVKSDEPSSKKLPGSRNFVHGGPKLFGDWIEQNKTASGWQTL